MNLFNLQVDDQMKLLQHSWSDMLVLDHIHQHMHNNLANEIMLHNGQKFDLLALGLLGVTTMAECFSRVIERLQELKFDVGDYICLKFLLLLNPGKYTPHAPVLCSEWFVAEELVLKIFFNTRICDFPQTSKGSGTVNTFMKVTSKC